MGRPPLPLGTWGEIHAARVPSGGWVARARYRDFDGVTRPVEARGKTEAAAKRELRNRLANRPTPRGAGLGLDTRVRVFADQLWDDLRIEQRVTARTIAMYQRLWRTDLAPAVGELRIIEATPGLLNAVIAAIHEKKPGTSTPCLSVLKQVMATAVRLDVLPTNPADGVAVPRVERKKVRALTLEELARLRANITAWQSGPRRPGYLLDIIDVMLGTGIRISDVCGLRWENVDFPNGKLVVDSHVVRGAEGGWEIVESTKSHSDYRRLTLPQFALTTLLARQATSTSQWVFPDSTGLDHARPASVMEQWRKARGEEFVWVGTHEMRKTVGTFAAAAQGSQAAADQLGHSSSRVTERHYIQRITDAPDLTAILDVFGSTN
ncbi:tyrosine integrase [Gordonia phage VanLee]|uniref:Integrase n=1 Tax=Gordonia phage VanLee TaxID=2845816 RepID=A0A8F2DA32_9CAUD|nr:tyrosine integrase [Gordonia phage VanLee]QWS68150.1 tyrosine integrase [Gordonia phage VanLee]